MTTRDKAASSNHTLDIHVRADIVDARDTTPRLAAYAFSSDARLLGSTTLSTTGEATLSVPAPHSAARLRILIGPELEREAEYSELLRRGAVERHLSVDREHLRHRIQLELLPDRWKCWLAHACVVRGTLAKRVWIGGQRVELPVCKATVEIYEVDPVWRLLPRLELSMLERLREVIINPPRPIPPPPEPFYARAPTPTRLRGSGLDALGRDARDALHELAGASELRAVAELGDHEHLRRTLIAYPDFSRLLLCRYFPLLVSMQRVGEAETDECGHFETRFFNGCKNPDVPDLYFKAKQRVFFNTEVYIYAPTPIACHTYWNYRCGTEVELYTHSPWARTCSPCSPVQGPPGNDRWVAFMAIGAHGLNRIHGTAIDLVATTTPDKLGLTDDGAPWGGSLYPRLEFAPGLEAAGVRYYRMSYRKGTSGDFIPLTGTVHRYYRHDVPTPTGDMPTWTPYILGPEAVDDGAGHQVPNLFQVPYHSTVPVANGVWDTPPDLPQVVEHHASAKFFSETAAPGMTYDETGALDGVDVSGKYQLALELFDAHGQPVDIEALGIVYAVPRDPYASGVISTVDADSLGLVVGSRMIITLHVDNNRCFAIVDAPTIGTEVADPCCGVLHYPSAADGSAAGEVTLGWQALHPHGFAQYRLEVVRGSRQVLRDPSAGWTPVSSTTSPLTVAVSTLLDTNLPAGCSAGGCPVAGFAADLYVDTLATNGWSRLPYDAKAVRAFVLSNT